MRSQEERGRILARDKRTRHLGGPTWFIPSENQRQSGAGYLVDVETETCSCRHYEQLQAKCRHLWAVQYVRSGEIEPQELPRGRRGDLLPQEQAHIRTALRYLRRCHGWEPLARAARFNARTLMKVAYGRPPSARLAVELARFAGVPVDDVLAGRYPTGVCPRCGYTLQTATKEGGAG